jgi:hypothetical protein
MGLMSTFYDPNAQNMYAAAQGYDIQPYQAGPGVPQSSYSPGGYQAGSQSGAMGLSPMLDMFGTGQYHQPYGLPQQMYPQQPQQPPPQPYYHVPTEYVPEEAFLDGSKPASPDSGPSTDMGFFGQIAGNEGLYNRKSVNYGEDYGGLAHSFNEGALKDLYGRDELFSKGVLDDYGQLSGEFRKYITDYGEDTYGNGPWGQYAWQGIGGIRSNYSTGGGGA